MTACSMYGAAKKIINTYPIGYEFTMRQFVNDVIRLYPRAKYNLSHTIDRRLREFRHGIDFDINCINPLRSLYRKDKIDLKKRVKR